MLCSLGVKKIEWLNSEGEQLDTPKQMQSEHLIHEYFDSIPLFQFSCPQLEKNQDNDQFQNQDKPLVQKLQIDENIHQSSQAKSSYSRKMDTPQTNQPDLLMFESIQTFRSQQQAQKSPLQQYLVSPKTVRPNKKFKALSNMIVGIHRMQRRQVEAIRDINDLSNEFPLTKQKSNSKCNSSKVYPLFNSHPAHFYEVLNNIRLAERFIELAQGGSPQDIKKMQQLMQMDPKRHVRSTRDPLHMLNCANKLGQNSLYLACKNGNAEVVQFLLQNDADPQIKSRVMEGMFETPLEVSTRWNHLKCVQLLLSNAQFQQDEIRRALDVATNEQIIRLLRSQSKQGWFSLCC